jgi:hypothetical protein
MNAVQIVDSTNTLTMTESFQWDFELPSDTQTKINLFNQHLNYNLKHVSANQISQETLTDWRWANLIEQEKRQGL